MLGLPDCYKWSQRCIVYHKIFVSKVIPRHSKAAWHPTSLGHDAAAARAPQSRYLGRRSQWIQMGIVADNMMVCL